MNSYFSKIHHVAVICSDYDRSRRFYTEVLGLPVIREVCRSERNSWKLDLAVGENAMLELFSFPDPPARPSYPEAAGLRHLAFEVESVQEVCEWLRKNGIEPEPVRIDPYTGKKCTFFRDPDDLPIELYER